MESTAKLFKNGRSQAVRLRGIFASKAMRGKSVKKARNLFYSRLKKPSGRMDSGTFLNRIRDLKFQSCHHAGRNILRHRKIACEKEGTPIQNRADSFNP